MRTCSAPRLFMSTQLNVFFIINDLLRRVNRNRRKTLQRVHGIVLRNFSKVNNMLKVPADDYGAPGNSRQGDMECIVGRSRGQNSGVKICLPKLQGFVGWFSHFGERKHLLKQIFDPRRCRLNLCTNKSRNDELKSRKARLPEKLHAGLGEFGIKGSAKYGGVCINSE